MNLLLLKKNMNYVFLLLLLDLPCINSCKAKKKDGESQEFRNT